MPRSTHRRGMHAFGADLRQDAAVGLFHQDGVEPIGAANQERARAHRIRYARGNFRAALGVARQARVGAGHSVERQDEDDHAAAVDRAPDLLARHAGPGGHGAEAGVLHRVPEPFVVLRRPPGESGAGEHRGVLAGAVVMQARGREARIAQQFRAATCHGFVRSTGQVAFLEAEVEEHLRGDGDVFGLAAVGRARERNLVIAPAEFLDAVRPR